MSPAACIFSREGSCYRGFIVWLATILAAAGCSSDYAARKKLTAQLASATKEMADLLSTVKDKSSAQTARPKIQSLVERVDDLTERMEVMDESVGTGDRAMLELHGQWIAEHLRLMQEQFRIGQLTEAREALGDTWQQLTGGAYDPGGVFAPGGTMDMGPVMNPTGVPLPGVPPMSGIPSP